MGKTVYTIIKKFNGGYSNDKRSDSANKFALAKHFDTLTYENMIVPRPSTTSTGEDKAQKLTRLLYAPSTASSGFSLYGFGVGSGTAHPKVFAYDIDAAGAVSFSAVGNGECSEGTRDQNVFKYYKGYLYMWQKGASDTYLARADVTTVAAFAPRYQTVSGVASTLAEPVLHPSDDIMYFFTDNRVHKLNNTVWTGDALTLPSNMKITCAAPYGNYLAIGCVTLGSLDQRSIVFLWDRDSSLTTLTSRIDFQEGAITHLATLDSRLVGVMGFYQNNTNSLAKGKMIVKYVVGDTAVPLGEVSSSSLVFTMPDTRMIRDNRLYFPANITHNGESMHGIWVVDSQGRMSVDFVEPEATSYEGIYCTGNVWWICHSGDGSLNHTLHTVGVATYGATATYDTLSIDGGDANAVKKAIGVSVSHEPLAGSVKVSYKKDEETNWTEIFTNSTAGSVSKSAVKTAAGLNLPEYREIQIRAEVTGNNGLTSIKLKSEIISKEAYD